MSGPILPQLRVVAIGGGTGLSTLLLGLKRYVATPGSPTGFERRGGSRGRTPSPCPGAPCLIRELAAVVTVTDDGGSSGRLREELQMLPPGDIRNCMVALSEDEHLLSRLFQYRFAQGDLEGHSFGNLFLAALNGISGDFAQAVQMSSQILATRGRIYPATTANATLTAQMDDGTVVRGETSITASKRSIVELMLEPPTAGPLPETLAAIANADLITLGPGSLYTSLITNLLVRGIPEAIAKSGDAGVHLQFDDAGERVAGADGVAAYREDPESLRRGAGPEAIRLRADQHGADPAGDPGEVCARGAGADRGGP